MPWGYAESMSNTNVEIANTILKQLGGGRVRAMTGAKTFVAIEKGLSFRFPNKRGPNNVRIVLTPADEYVVEFHRVAGSKITSTAKIEGAHAEDLAGLFEKHTGLRLSL